MDFVQLLLFLLVGLIAGWLAGKVIKGRGFGILGDLIIGVIGAYLGGFLFGLLRINLGGGIIGSLIVAFIGAVILVWVIRLIK